MMEALGLDAWIARLARAGTSIGTRTRADIERTKTDIKATAVDLAPVHDGVLRDSIEETEDGVAATARHAAFVEFGTYKDAPQPYMGPAADEHEGAFVERLADTAGDI